jgi:hypothetical protein
MSAPDRLKQELKALGLVALYFAMWLSALLLVKQLVLAEYDIQFAGFSKALIGALVLSKVVLVLEYVPLGRWVERQPALVDVLLRTALYLLGVFFVLLLEKGFEGRHEYGSFFASLTSVFRHADFHHVWLNLLVVSGALLNYNILSVVRRHLGGIGLLQLLMLPSRGAPEGVKRSEHR